MNQQSQPQATNQTHAAELMELERTLIPVLNRVREQLGKPRIILPKPGERWRIVKPVDQRV